jgi:hypothetical protein
MSGPRTSTVGTGEMLEIIAFRLHDEEFYVRARQPSARFADGGQPRPCRMRRPT